MSSPVFETLCLKDGARLAYEILGVEHLGNAQPIVLIGGMSSLRGDWERLSCSLATVRPGKSHLDFLSKPAVLIFDHRGMGNSTFHTAMGHLTIELLARDIVELVKYLKWEKLSICGFSMGGVIAQQILLLPHLPSNPLPLPFQVTHVLLTGTLCSVLRDKRYGLKVNTAPPKHRTQEEKREIARPTLEATFEPAWLASSANSERFNWWLDRMTSGRPTRMILMQGRALNRFDFTGLHTKLSRDTQVMVIHGELDEVVPFYCGQEIMQCIPWARFVEVGPLPGQIPNLAFGHHWFEYFDIQVWKSVVESFLGKPNAGLPEVRARL